MNFLDFVHSVTAADKVLRQNSCFWILGVERLENGFRMGLFEVNGE